MVYEYVAINSMCGWQVCRYKTAAHDTMMRWVMVMRMKVGRKVWWVGTCAEPPPPDVTTTYSVMVGIATLVCHQRVSFKESSH